MSVTSEVISQQKKNHALRGRLRATVFFLFLLLFSLPLLVVVFSLLTPAPDVWRHLAGTVLPEYIINSFILMAGVGSLTLVLGLVPAWLVTMFRFPGSRILEWALLLPLAIPAYIIAYTYTGVMDVSGPVQTLLRDLTGWGYQDYWFPQIRSLGGAITMLSFVLYPYIYLISRAAFLSQSICVLEAARTLGCGPYQTFFKIALPLARPGIIVGLSLVLMETLADYGTVQYFGIAAFTTGIFRTWFGLGNSIAAAQLSALLMLFIAALVIIEYQSRKRQRYHHTSERFSTLKQKQLKGFKAFFLSSICTLPVLVGFIFPVGFLIKWALMTYEKVIDHAFLTLVWHSVSLSAAAAVIAVLLALWLAYGKRRSKSIVIRFSVNICGMGYAIPGTVIAVGVMLPLAWLDKQIDQYLRSEFDFGIGLLFSGSLIALVFAYLVRFLAVSLKTVESGLTRIKPSMEEAGRSLGMNEFKLLRKIHIPILKGSLLTALLLVFVDVLKELPATLILRPFDFNTLAVRAYEFANEERLAYAACPSLAIVLAGIIPVIYLSYSISRSRPGHDFHG